MRVRAAHVTACRIESLIRSFESPNHPDELRGQFCSSRCSLRFRLQIPPLRCIEALQPAKSYLNLISYRSYSACNLLSCGARSAPRSLVILGESCFETSNNVMACRGDDSFRFLGHRGDVRVSTFRACLQSISCSMDVEVGMCSTSY